jgi:hypothetical protein
MRTTYLRREGQMLSTYISVSKLKLCVRLIFHMMSSLPPAHMLSGVATDSQRRDGCISYSKQYIESSQFLQLICFLDSFISFDAIRHTASAGRCVCTVYAVDSSYENL